MKKLIFLLTVVLIMCSCAGTGQQKIMYVEDYNFSVQTPPSSWRQLDVAKEMERAFQKKFRGHRGPPDPELEAMVKKIVSNELARQDVGFFAWRKGNDSQIMIGAKEHNEESKQKTYKVILSSQIDNRLNDLLNNYQEAKESIDSENEGIFREGIEFASIEATIKCFNDSGKLSYTEKMVSYVLNTDSHVFSRNCTQKV